MPRPQRTRHGRAPKRARAGRHRTGVPTGAAAFAYVSGVLGLAAAGHWLLRRAARRIPILLARRAGGAPAGGRRAALAIGAAARLALWLLVAQHLTARVPAVHALGAALADPLAMRLDAPLFSVAGRAYSAVDLLLLPTLLAAVWLAVGVAARLLRRHLLDAAVTDPGARESILVLARYGVTFLGALLVVDAYGIDVSSLTMLASVLGLGLGFGLQNIANNFVSGLLLGMERPIRPGDFVQVGEFEGTVERIGARSTEIRTLDRVAILVPNSRLLESEVVNWSHGNPVSRLHLPVGVAYGTDLRRARAALLEAAATHPDVLKDPRPSVECRGFGDSAMDLELLVWTRDPRTQHRLQSDLYFRVAVAFRRHAIEIPYRQHDVNFAPALERIALAWGRRHFTPAELAPAEGPADDLADVEDAFAGPRVLDDAALTDLVARLRGPGGLDIRDRRHLFAIHRRCFVGSDLVDWLARTESLPREQATAVGRQLVGRGVAHHVLDEHDFRDGHYFYRFRADETEPAARRTA